MARAASAIDELFAELRTQVEKVLETATPQTHQHFFERLGISSPFRSAFVHGSMQHGMVYPLPKSCIPAVIHRIWLTDPDNPRLPREYYIGRIRNQILRFGDAFEHVFWYNSDGFVEWLAKLIKPLANVTYKHIAEMSSNSTLDEAVRKAVVNRKFVLASDICKYRIIHAFGGIYMDLGIELAGALADLISVSRVLLFLDRNLFYQPAFMAAPPSHPAFDVWCRLLMKPEVLASIVLGEGEAITGHHEIWLHGGVGFSAALMMFCNPSIGVLPISPNRGLLHCESEGSWYNPGGKFGNATIGSAPVSHLSDVICKEMSALNQDVRATLTGFSQVELARIYIMRHIQNTYWSA